MENKRNFRIADLMPAYSWACLGLVFLSQSLVFWATRPILAHLTPLDLSTALDGRIPFRPEWVSVYVLSFASWIVTMVLLLRGQQKQTIYRNTAAYLCTLLLTLILFLTVPAAIARPEVPGRDFFSFLTRVVYFFDQPNNLFPSLHVVCSWYCWRVIDGTETGVPRWYKWFNLIFFLLVCASILFVKQHVAVDIPSGILVAEVPILLSRRFRWERAGLALEARILGRRARKGQ